MKSPSEKFSFGNIFHAIFGFIAGFYDDYFCVLWPVYMVLVRRNRIIFRIVVTMKIFREFPEVHIKTIQNVLLLLHHVYLKKANGKMEPKNSPAYHHCIIVCTMCTTMATVGAHRRCHFLVRNKTEIKTTKISDYKFVIFGTNFIISDTVMELQQRNVREMCDCSRPIKHNYWALMSLQNIFGACNYLRCT